MDFLFSNYFKDKQLRPFALELAKLNNISVTQVESFDGRNTGGININQGNIQYINDNPNWDIILHEICHILVVEPEYRHLVSDDTQTAYKVINKQYPDKKDFRRESVTFGLQHLIYTKYNLNFSVQGFYSGSVGVGDSKIPKYWIDKAKELSNVYYDGLHCSSNYIPMPFLSSITPNNNVDLLVLLYRSEHNEYKLYDAKYVNGYFIINGKKYMGFEIFKWCYKY